MKLPQLTPQNNEHWHLAANYPNETTRGRVICFDSRLGACTTLLEDVEESLRGVNAPSDQITEAKERASEAMFNYNASDFLRNQGYAHMAAGLIYWVQWVHILRAECPYRLSNTGKPGLISDSRTVFNEFIVMIERAIPMSDPRLSEMEKRVIMLAFRARLDPDSAARLIKAYRVADPVALLSASRNQRPNRFG